MAYREGKLHGDAELLNTIVVDLYWQSALMHIS